MPVALLMENRPDYICAWLGLFKVGAQVALINTNLVGMALAHSIAICGARHAIVGAELAGELSRGAVSRPCRQLWIEGEGGNLTAALAAASDKSPGKQARAGVTLKERAFFIYTSGTTGLPKAANFSHMRMLFMMSGFVGRAAAARKTTASTIPCRSIIPPAGSAPWAWRSFPAGR